MAPQKPKKSKRRYYLGKFKHMMDVVNKRKALKKSSEESSGTATQCLLHMGRKSTYRYPCVRKPRYTSRLRNANKARSEAKTKSNDNKNNNADTSKAGLPETTEGDASGAGSSTIFNIKKEAEENNEVDPLANTTCDLSIFHKPIFITEADLNGLFVGIIKQEVWEFQEPE